MKKMRVQILSAAVTCLMVTSFVVGQQQRKPLTNADVITMLKAQLPESTIVLAIQQSPANYDTSPQGLIDLKNQGASQQVLEALLQAQSGKTSNPFAGGSSEPVQAGITLVAGSDRIKLKASETDIRATSGGALGAVNPFGKVRTKDTLSGKQAQLRITNTSPTFELALLGDVYPTDHVVLVKLAIKSDRREIETGSVGAFSDYISGYRKKDIIPITFDEFQSQGGTGGTQYKSYRVKIASALAVGEYALVVDNVYYAFGVDGGK